MKKTLLLMAVVSFFAVTNVSAQIRKIPAEVTEAFKAKFPDAASVEWKDKLTNFQASFAKSNAKWTAEFTAKGEWKESTKELNFDALPAAVKDGFTKSKYSDWKTGSVIWIERSDDENAFRIYAEKAALQKLFLFFDKNGQLKKETPGI